jgi:hypothetical protein
MRFGFFDQLPCAEGYSERQRYQDIMAQIELGDALGFQTAWLGELHFSRPFSILANPLMVLAAAAQRTRRIRLGTAVTLLPLHNPVKVAEEAATADILSDGRLEFGVGRGTAPLHYVGYDIPQEESRERFEEGLDFILQAWTHESFSYQGKYFRAGHHGSCHGQTVNDLVCQRGHATLPVRQKKEENTNEIPPHVISGDACMHRGSCSFLPGPAGWGTGVCHACDARPGLV